jgi:hypothetical protein
VKRGRKSIAELSVITPNAGHMPAPPPAELTDAQAAVWRDVAGSLPSNWLTRAAHPVLIEFCRHVCRARLLEQHIAQFEIEWTAVEGGLERLDRMLAMAARETVMMNACARALRLAPQQRIEPKTAGRRIHDMPQAIPPWDFK